MSAGVFQAPLFLRTGQRVHVARRRCTRQDGEHVRALLKPWAEDGGLKLVPEVVRGERNRGPVLALEGTRDRAIGAGLARATACPGAIAALRRATKKTSCGRQLISAQRLDFPNASRSASRLDHIGHDGTDSKCMFRSYRIRTA